MDGKEGAEGGGGREERREEEQRKQREERQKDKPTLRRKTQACEIFKMETVK